MSLSIRYILLAFSLLSLVACSNVKGPVIGYDGPQRPVDEIALVKIPVEIDLDKLDGRKYALPHKQTGNYELHIEQGRHNLIVRFETDRFEKDGWPEYTEMLIKSDYMVLQCEFVKGHTYQIEYNRASDIYEFRQLAFNFDVSMHDENTGAICKSTFLDGTIAPGKKKTSEQTEKDVIDKLKYWWLLADKSQKAEFNEWYKTVPDNYQTPVSDDMLKSMSSETGQQDVLKSLKLWWLHADKALRGVFLHWRK